MFRGLESTHSAIHVRQKGHKKAIPEHSSHFGIHQRTRDKLFNWKSFLFKYL